MLLLTTGCAGGADASREAAAMVAAVTTAKASVAAVEAIPIQTPAARAALDRADALVGQGADSLRRTLGEPDLRRVEGAAEIWLYLAPGCALDLVLYRRGGGMAVAHAAARARGTGPGMGPGMGAVTEAQCLDAIVAAAR